MTLTSPACPAGPEILRNAVAAIETMEGISKANVKLVMSPPWSPDRMTDAAQGRAGNLLKSTPGPHRILSVHIATVVLTECHIACIKGCMVATFRVVFYGHDSELMMTWCG